MKCANHPIRRFSSSCVVRAGVTLALVERVDFLRTRRGLSVWIAEQVLRDAPCPTFVVPQASEAPALADSVLCAVDFSPASHAPGPRGSANQCLTLLHVVDGRGSNDHVPAGGLVTHEFRRGLGADAMVTLQSMIPLWHVATAETRVGRMVLSGRRPWRIRRERARVLCLTQSQRDYR